MNTLVNDGKFLTVAVTPTAEQEAVARAPIGVSDEAMTAIEVAISAIGPHAHRIAMADLELTHIRRRWTNWTTDNAPIAAIPLAISRFFSVAFGFAPHVIPRFLF